MASWVLAAERGYVAAAVGTSGAPPAEAGSAGGAEPALADRSPAQRAAHAGAAAGAVASRYLAVGTPRSFGIVIDRAGDAEAAALALVAHRTWFAPRDVRCASADGSAAALAAATGGRAVSIDEALACDIVHLHGAATPLTPAKLRRGTHVNVVHHAAIDPELARLATLVREAELPALAAGLVDGRQLDEITIFAIDGAPIAAAALTSSTGWPG